MVMPSSGMAARTSSAVGIVAADADADDCEGGSGVPEREPAGVVDAPPLWAGVPGAEGAAEVLPSAWVLFSLLRSGPEASVSLPDAMFLRWFTGWGLPCQCLVVRNGEGA